MKSLNSYSLIAPCGMNCGVCWGYLRDKNKCPGCRTFDANKPITHIRCKILKCKILRKNKMKFCFDCDNLPCEPLELLDKRYRTKYGMSMLENLKYIKNFGIRKFIKSEKARWTCPECGRVICVHKGFCVACGIRK
jgi:hypothetical protein